MKTVDDILDLFVGIINVSTITAIIDGNVFPLEKELNSEAQDIVIRPLSINGPQRTGVQDGTVLINSYCKNFSTGRPNRTFLSSVVNAQVSALESFSDLSTYFTLDIISQNIYPDEQNSKMSFANIRVNYWIEA